MEIIDLNCTYPDDFDEMSGANLNFRHSIFKSFERKSKMPKGSYESNDKDVSKSNNLFEDNETKGENLFFVFLIISDAFRWLLNGD